MKQTKKHHKILKKYKNSSVFVHSHSLSDEDPTSTKVTKPVTLDGTHLDVVRGLIELRCFAQVHQ